MIVHEQEPFNAETPRAQLARSPLTAIDVFYVRSHGPVPQAGPGWRLRVGGLVERELDLTLEELTSGFAARELTATLQCAGNRRSDLIAVREIPGEAPWGSGATGTAAWSGVALADVLAAAGPRPGARHVALIGADDAPEAPSAQTFGGSITLEKAQQPEVLLALTAGGEPLTPAQGVTLIPSLALATVRDDVVLRRLDDPLLRRHVSVATLACGYRSPAVAPMRAILHDLADRHCFECDARVAAA